MAQLFEAIGIPFVDRKATSARLEELCERGVAVPRADGGSMVTWTDPSGAIMVFNIDERRVITCARPAFASESKIRIQPFSIVPDEECQYCDRVAADIIADEVGAMGTFYMHVSDMAVSRERIPFRQISSVSVSLFAEGMRVWRDGEEFLASQDSRKRKFAPECLLLTGGFSKPPAAELRMMGTVLQTEMRRNTATGEAFVWANVRTSEFEFEVVAPEEQVPLGVSVGNVVDGTFWVVGHVVGQ